MHLAYMQVMWRQKISSCVTEHNYRNYLGRKAVYLCACLRECVCVCVCLCVWDREREKERERR